MNDSEIAEIREKIAELLAAGLETEVEPFPRTEKEFGEVVNRLRQIDRDDLVARLVVSGFLDHPYGPENWRCADCIYYLAHRKWCDLPDLALPVEADWYCKLWRM